MSLNLSVSRVTGYCRCKKIIQTQYRDFFLYRSLLYAYRCELKNKPYRNKCS